MRRILTFILIALCFTAFASVAGAATPKQRETAQSYSSTPFPPFTQEEVYSLFLNRLVTKSPQAAVFDKSAATHQLGDRVLYQNAPPRNSIYSEQRRFTIFPGMPYFDEKYAFDLTYSTGIYHAVYANGEAVIGESKLPIKEIVYSGVSKDARFLIEVEIDMANLDFEKMYDYLVKTYGEEGVWTYGELIPEKYLPKSPAISLDEKCYFNENGSYIIALYKSLTQPGQSHLIFLNNAHYVRAMKKLEQQFSPQWHE